MAEVLVDFHGNIGLYQVNATLAHDTPLGDAAPIVIEIGGTQSPPDITIAVSPAAAAATTGAR
jgi:uncharacterized protein (TIGR03437 family)